MDTNKINASFHLGPRPYCPCCGGGEIRKGYTVTKAKSRKLNNKNKKAKPKYKDHRI